MEAKIFTTGIKVKEGGMKGLEVSYSHQEEKDGKTWNIEDWQDRKIPIGEKLDDVIKAFRWYLMDIFGYEMTNANIADCKIKEIKFSGDIMISGELRVLNGDRTVNLKTCKIDDACEYEKINELRKLIGQLKDEVALYMEGKSVMSDSQLVMQFYKSKGKFDEAEFEGMTEDQRVEKATEILEKFGSLVIHQKELTPADSFAITAVDEIKKEEMVEAKNVVEVKAEAVVVTPNFGAAPVVEEKVVVPLITEENGEEVFSITPVASAK